MTNLESYLAVDWPAEEAALAQYFQSRNLSLPQIASLLELCLAEAVGALSQDPTEASDAMARILQRSQTIAAECCRASRPATH